MKKQSIIFILILFPLALLAQFKGTVNINSGYESNIFKNPDSYFRDNNLLGKDSLYTNSFYSEIGTNMSYIKKWKENSFKVKGYGGAAYYYTAVNAHKYKYKLEASYRTRYDEGKYFELAPEIFRIRKNGIDQTETILRTPYSYSKFVFPFNFDFYLGNKAWLKVQPAYLYKKYDTHAPEKLYYHSWYINALFKKKFVNDTIQQQIAVTLDISNRFYSDFELPSNIDPELIEILEEDLIHKTRQWEYYKLNLEYSLKTQNNKLQAKFPIEVTYKRDRLSDFFSYFEVKGTYNLQYNIKKLSLLHSASISNRDYLTFTIDQNTKLKYNYLRASAGIKYNLNDFFILKLSGNYVKRFSNRTDYSKKYYRAYETSYVEFGVTYKF